MTLKELIDTIIKVAKKQPNIGYVNEGDIFELNSLPNIDYSVIYITQTNHSVNADTIEYNINLFYVDRLMNDKSNRLEVQSHGINVLTNIINVLSNYYDVDVELPLSFTTFVQRFVDECAGVFANIKITTESEMGICGYE